MIFVKRIIVTQCCVELLFIVLINDDVKTSGEKYGVTCRLDRRWSIRRTLKVEINGTFAPDITMWRTLQSQGVVETSGLATRETEE